MAQIGKKVFKLINDEVIFGECFTMVSEETGIGEILIKSPFTAKGGRMIPYMVDVMGSAPAAVQIHPMNIVWQVPLDEFPEALKGYIEATSGIITETKSSILVSR
jgi:hypothetical protein